MCVCEDVVFVVDVEEEGRQLSSSRVKILKSRCRPMSDADKTSAVDGAKERCMMQGYW